MNRLGRFSVRGRLVLGSGLVPGTLIVEGGKIDAVLPGLQASDLPEPVVDAMYVAPGLVDLQVNGGFGAAVGTDPEAFRLLARRLPETGVTAFLPTVVTAPRELYPQVFDAFAASCDAPGARMLGLHLEGPFVSPQRPGAHRRDLMRGPDPRLLDGLLEPGLARLMTIAPELPGALDTIRRLRERNVVVALGHTDATYEDFVAGIDAGATLATHLFNAMSPFHHRAPHAAGAALIDCRITAGLIPDGIHVHPAALELVLRARGVDRIALVTDMMAAATMPPGDYQLGGRIVRVDGASARLEDGTLAGSILTLDQGIRNMVAWTRATIGDAIRMASEAPARILDMNRIGRLAAGLDADLVLLDEHLHVEQTFVGGERVFARSSGARA